MFPCLLLSFLDGKLNFMSTYSNNLIIHHGQQFTYRLFRFKRIIQELHIDCIYENEDTFCRWLVKLSQNSNVQIDKIWTIFEAYSQNVLDKNIEIVFPTKIDDPFDSLRIIIKEVKGTWESCLLMIPAPVRIHDKFPSMIEYPEEKILKLQNDITMYREKIARYEKDTDELITRLEFQHEEYELVREQFREKNEECENLRTQYLSKHSECEEECEELYERIHTFETECNDLRTTLIAKSEECENLRTEWDAQKHENVDVRAELTSKSKECDDLRTELDIKNRECNDLRTELTSKNRECDDLLAKIETKNKEYDDLRKKSSYQKTFYSSMTKKNGDKLLASKNKECEELRAQLNSKNEECDHLRSKLTMENNECETLKRTCQLQTEECAQLRTRLDESMVQLENFVLQRDNPRGSSQEDNDELRTRLQNSEESLELYKKTCDDCKKQSSDSVSKNQQLIAQNSELMRTMTFFSKTQPIKPPEIPRQTENNVSDEITLDDMFNRILDKQSDSTNTKYPDPSYYKDNRYVIPGKLLINNCNKLIRSAIHSAVHGKNDDNRVSKENARYPNYIHEYHVSYCEWKNPNYSNVVATSFHIGVYEYGVVKTAGTYVSATTSKHALTPKTLYRNFVSKYKAKEFLPILEITTPSGFINTIFCSDVTITIPEKIQGQLVFRHNVRMVGYAGQRTFLTKIDLSPDNIVSLIESDFIKANYDIKDDDDDFMTEYRNQQEHYKLFYYD